MKEYPVPEALKSTLRIEEESFAFFLHAGIRFMKPDMMRLANELAELELEHVNRIRTLLEQEPMTVDELRKELTSRRPPSEPIVRTQPLSDDASPREILEVALAREDETRRTYEMMSTFTTLSREIIGLLSFLAREEAAHAAKIREWLVAAESEE